MGKRILLVLAIAVVVLAGCRKPVAPKVSIIVGPVKIQSMGGPNYVLLCPMEVFYATAGRTMQIVEAVAGERSVSYEFRGDTARVHIDEQLTGTFVNDGNSVLLEALQKEVIAYQIREMALQNGQTIPLLQYEGVDGRDVRYDLQLKK